MTTRALMKVKVSSLLFPIHLLRLMQVKFSEQVKNQGKRKKNMQECRERNPDGRAEDQKNVKVLSF